MKELVKNVGERGQDNLIAGLFPRALIVPVSIVAGAGELARGTVLSCKEDGTCEVMAAGGTPAYVLAAVAYRSGNFNPDAVTVAEGYTLTAADKDTLRKYDIIFTRVLPE